MFQLTSQKIKREEIIQSTRSNKAGALVIFEGWVRDHNEGNKVASLEYQVYEELAQKEGEKILIEAKHKFNLHHASCTHRFGHLALGDTAVIVAASASHREDAFKAARYVIDEIKLRLPVWKKEHYVEQKAEWVFCRDHQTHVHFKETDYYAKQARLADQDVLKKSRVLVIGAGGLGCPVLTSFAMAGVGHLDLVDFDVISISNIHRQPLYSPENVGEKKVAVAKAKLSSLNPFIHVHAHDQKISANNVERFIQAQHLVVDCTDNLETKFLLHDACYKHRIPLVSASIYQFEGQVRTFNPLTQNGCLRCTFPTTPDDSKLGNCNDFGVLGASVGVIGTLQANESLLFLLNRSNNTLDSTFYFDLQTLTQMKIKNLKQENCAVCKGQVEIKMDDFEIELSDLTDDFELVDIREKEDSYLENWQRSDKKIAAYCFRGLRSKRLVKDLRDRGYTHYYSLRGGACSL